MFSTGLKPTKSSRETNRNMTVEGTKYVPFILNIGVLGVSTRAGDMMGIYKGTFIGHYVRC